MAAAAAPQQQTSADGLDDWWTPTPILAAPDSDEGGEDAAAEVEEGAGRPRKGKGRKNPRPDGDEAGAAGPAASEKAGGAAKNKRRKIGEHLKNRTERLAERQAEMLAQMGGTAETACALLWAAFTEVKAALPSDELDQLKVNAAHFAHAGAKHRCDGDAAFLCKFLKNVKTEKHLLQRRSGMARASPRVLVVSSTAKRAVALGKVLKSIATNSKIATLVPRHMKTDAQAQLLKGNTFVFAVGTPHRIQLLLDAGDLMLTETKLCVVDAAWVNPKKRTFLEERDARAQLMDLLEKHVLPACIETDLKLALF